MVQRLPAPLNMPVAELPPRNIGGRKTSREKAVGRRKGGEEPAAAGVEGAVAKSTEMSEPAAEQKELERLRGARSRETRTHLWR